ncbi:hypothetical protein PAK_P400166 [Pseudomonas phage PAK_P4]|uniref:Uncharacterized protein n=1 Tax=Pseudomonas phage PAK_P4 TaxID=1327966 RepID=V5JXP4_9CAUD|nr:hypothetical protein PAK_P400166 [Pseudomonas phage PAK_P4]AGR89462.1 hypothetical protein PAK_P400166 [Pseudomonas phage PAK_P4]
MRDEFEAWWRSAEVLKSKRAVAFDAWQASRAALMVELPAKRSYSMYVTEHECHAFNDAIEKAKEALQQAGIEVK